MVLEDLLLQLQYRKSQLNSLEEYEISFIKSRIIELGLGVGELKRFVEMLNNKEKAKKDKKVGIKNRSRYICHQMPELGERSVAEWTRILNLKSVPSLKNMKSSWKVAGKYTFEYMGERVVDERMECVGNVTGRVILREDLAKISNLNESSVSVYIRKKIELDGETWTLRRRNKLIG